MLPWLDRVNPYVFELTVIPLEDVLDVRPLLAYNMRAAAAQRGTKESQFKRSLRRHGVRSWPNRQIRSLVKLLRDDHVQRRLDDYMYVARVLECFFLDPSFKVPERVSKIRQASFKRICTTSACERFQGRA